METRQIGIPNQMSVITGEFLAGEPFGPKASLRVINSFDLADEIKEDEYDFFISNAKRILSDIKKDDHRDVIFLEPQEELSIKTMAVIVRLLNLAHKGRYFILLNDGILYCPQEYSNHSLEEINRHLIDVIRSKEQTKKVVEFKRKIRSFFNVFKLNEYLVSH